MAWSRLRARAQVAVGVAGPAVALLVLPAPAAVMRQFGDPRADVVLGAITLLAVTAVTWALLLWAAILCVAAAAARLPGFAGLCARRAMVRLAPAAARRVLAVAAGVSLAAGLVACGPAPTAGVGVSAGAPPMTTSTPAGRAVHLRLDWPLDTAASPAEPAPTGRATTVDTATEVPTTGRARDEAAEPRPGAGDTPPAATRTGTGDGSAPSSAVTSAAEPAAASASPAPPAAAPPAHAPETDNAGADDDHAQRPTVTVRRGDTLWAIAREHLPAGATDAEIDRSWRAWYAANRTVIGPDPNLILPGQRLTAPAPRTVEP